MQSWKVPLLVGTFHDCIYLEVEPRERSDIGRMIEALRKVEAETPEPVCYIISGDLAHLGPKFGDEQPVAEAQVVESHDQDRALLKQAAAADPARYFRTIADEHDRRRICGLAPTYLVLEAARPARGRVLHYQ